MAIAPNDLSYALFLVLYAVDTWFHLRSARKLSPDRNKWKGVTAWRIVIVLAWAWAFSARLGEDRVDWGMILTNVVYFCFVARNTKDVLHGKEWSLGIR